MFLIPNTVAKSPLTKESLSIKPSLSVGKRVETNMLPVSWNLIVHDKRNSVTEQEGGGGSR